ncbi:hypothetical protein EVAR_56700_1 [Eumeta japonica]|uniref:Uncharacterized protein n=1 Tax=Eumeta variegata TaxID=151549 RepID=A0A4C1XXW1_EUMVA|nr:hypothetical protein EVAR_56700_1 [Eumeta japonica]
MANSKQIYWQNREANYELLMEWGNKETPKDHPTRNGTTNVRPPRPAVTVARLYSAFTTVVTRDGTRYHRVKVRVDETRGPRYDLPRPISVSLAQLRPPRGRRLAAAPARKSYSTTIRSWFFTHLEEVPLELRRPGAGNAESVAREGARRPRAPAGGKLYKATYRDTDTQKGHVYSVYLKGGTTDAAARTISYAHTHLTAIKHRGRRFRRPRGYPTPRQTTYLDFLENANGTKVEQVGQQ